MWGCRWGATWCTAATARRTACARRVSCHASLRGRKLHAGSVCAASACEAVYALLLCSMGCAKAAFTGTGPCSQRACIHSRAPPSLVRRAVVRQGCPGGVGAHHDPLDCGGQRVSEETASSSGEHSAAREGKDYRSTHGASSTISPHHSPPFPASAAAQPPAPLKSTAIALLSYHLFPCYQLVLQSLRCTILFNFDRSSQVDIPGPCGAAP